MDATSSPHSNELHSEESRGGLSLVLPAGRKGLDTTVVASQSVDLRFVQDQTKLRVLVLGVLLQVLTDGDGLLDQMMQVFRDRRRQLLGLQDTEDLGSGDVADLRDSEGITKGDTDLRRGETLLGELADVLGDFNRLHLQP